MNDIDNYPGWDFKTSVTEITHYICNLHNHIGRDLSLDKLHLIFWFADSFWNDFSLYCKGLDKSISGVRKYIRVGHTLYLPGLNDVVDSLVEKKIIDRKFRSLIKYFDVYGKGVNFDYEMMKAIAYTVVYFSSCNLLSLRLLLASYSWWNKLDFINKSTIDISSGEVGSNGRLYRFFTYVSEKLSSHEAVRLPGELS